MLVTFSPLPSTTAYADVMFPEPMTFIGIPPFEANLSPSNLTVIVLPGARSVSAGVVSAPYFCSPFDERDSLMYPGNS